MVWLNSLPLHGYHSHADGIKYELRLSFFDGVAMAILALIAPGAVGFEVWFVTPRRPETSSHNGFEGV